VFLSQPLYAWSISFAKISVSLCLLRIQPRVLAWRIFLSILIIWQLVIGVVITYFQMSLCKPISASWKAVSTSYEGVFPPSDLVCTSKPGTADNSQRPHGRA